MVLEIHGHHHTLDMCIVRRPVRILAGVWQPGQHPSHSLFLGSCCVGSPAMGSRTKKPALRKQDTGRHLERGKNRNEKNCPEWDRHIEKVRHSITTAAAEQPVTHRPVHSPRPQQQRQPLHARVCRLTSHANMQPLRPSHNQGAPPFLPKDQEKSLMFCTGL